MKPSDEAKKEAAQRAREHEQRRKDNEAFLRAKREEARKGGKK